MSTTVTTQAEMDAALAAGAETIIIRSPRGVRLTISDSGSSTVEAYDSSTVRASGAVFRSGHQAGFSKDQLKRSKKRLGIEASKTAFSAGWAWTLPAATPEDHEGSAHHAEGSEGSEGSKPPSEPLPSALPSPRDNSTPPQAGKGAEVAVLAEEPETRREHPREHTSRASAPFAPFAPLGGQALPSQTPTCHLHPDRPRPDACYTCEQAANADASQDDDHDTMPLFGMPA